MISPHTPPGTRIVCISTDPKLGLYRTRKPASNYISEGKVYTVKDMQVHCRTGDVVVRLREIPQYTEGFGFSLKRFELAALPKCLTDCLTATPVNTDTCEVV